MATIAVIGGDGAGKTTVTRKLLESGPLPFRYLYMGINLESSNVALPTSRIIQRLKRPRNVPEGAARSAGTRGRKGGLRSWLRLAYRLSEEWFRQVLALAYQLRGFVVLCDRHFVFDFHELAPRLRARPRAERLHHWLLQRLYPRPDLTIFLDAPPEVLIARKGEGTPEFHAGRRAAILELGRGDPRFVRIDATRPLEVVFEEVLSIVRRFGARSRGSAPDPQPRRAA